MGRADQGSVNHKSQKDENNIVDVGAHMGGRVYIPMKENGLTLQIGERKASVLFPDLGKEEQ